MPKPTASPFVRRPVATVLLAVASSVLACGVLTACDAAAQHGTPARAAAVPALSVDARPAATPVAERAPLASQGGAALHDYREDVDPSHAAVASYRD